MALIVELKLKDGKSVYRDSNIDTTEDENKGMIEGKTLTLPKSVKNTEQLSDNFEDFLKEKQIEILKSTNLSEIGETAFYACNQIKEVDFPNVKILEESCFAYCDSLEEANFSKVTEVKNEAFLFCKKFKKLKMPKIIKIGEDAFRACISLEKFDFSNVTLIERSAFTACNTFEKVSIPKITELSEGVFTKCDNLSEIDIPNVIRICRLAFCECKKLKKVCVSDKLSSIGKCSFGYCEMLEKIEGITDIKDIKIGKDAFIGCTKFNQPGARYNHKFELELVDGNFVNAKVQNKILTLPKEITNTDQLKKEKFDDFMNNFEIKVIRSKYLKTIGTNFLEENQKINKLNFPNVCEIKSSAFRHCRNLIEIHAPNVTEIEKLSFSYCEKLKNVNFPRIEKIKSHTFINCFLLKEGIFTNVTIVEDHVFGGCWNLEKVYVSKNLKSIEEKAFIHCENLEEILDEEQNVIDLTEIQINPNTFENCKKLSSGKDCGICLNCYLMLDILNNSSTIIACPHCSKKFHKDCTRMWISENEKAQKNYNRVQANREIEARQQIFRQQREGLERQFQELQEKYAKDVDITKRESPNEVTKQVELADLEKQFKLNTEDLENRLKNITIKYNEYRKDIEKNIRNAPIEVRCPNCQKKVN